MLPARALERALYRNFGGKPRLLEAAVKIFRDSCLDAAPLRRLTSPEQEEEEEEAARPATLDLLAENLDDGEARHLMVLTRQGAALPVKPSSLFRSLAFGINLESVPRQGALGCLFLSFAPTLACCL